uniref:Endonuclease/exonuclease/phosphatase domain-containing protein n=1 Tax=Triticum urartu TaxID=4572 RepID=A0A8R7QH09_TRIUA
MKKKFTPGRLRKIDPFSIFSWNWIPSVGKSGGILCGVRNDNLDIISCDKGKYILQLVLYDKKKKTNWGLLIVYGSAHEEFKEEFLSELASMCGCMQIPYIFGGDFNILRHSGEKNKKLCNHKSSDIFNSIINTLALREIHISGGKYTWTNNQAHPTLE